MGRSLNQVYLIGVVTETLLLQTEGGLPVLHMQMQMEQQPLAPETLELTALGKEAEFLARVLTVDAVLAVEGTLRGNWKDPAGGQVYPLRVIVNRLLWVQARRVAEPVVTKAACKGEPSVTAPLRKSAYPKVVGVSCGNNAISVYLPKVRGVFTLADPEWQEGASGEGHIRVVVSSDTEHGLLDNWAQYEGPGLGLCEDEPPEGGEF